MAAPFASKAAGEAKARAVLGWLIAAGDWPAAILATADSPFRWDGGCQVIPAGSSGWLKAKAGDTGTLTFGLCILLRDDDTQTAKALIRLDLLGTRPMKIEVDIPLPGDAFALEAA